MASAFFRIGQLIEERRRHLGTTSIVNTREDDFEHEVSGYFFPMLSSSLLSAIESRLASGSESMRVMRLSSMENACEIRPLDLFRCSLDAAGSGTPQCAVIGCPGHTGQTSFAALSQTVKTKFITGASGLANSSHDLLRKPAVLRPRILDLPKRLRANLPDGWLPAL